MSKKVYQVTKHGKERIRQRTKYSRNTDIKNLFRQAIIYGKSPSEFDPPFSLFLKSKLKGGILVKVYQGMIFIYKGRLLITSYQVPDKYQHQISLDKRKKSIMAGYNGKSNKVLRETFIQAYDMLLSKCQLAEAIEIYYDGEEFKDMFNSYVKLDAIIEVFRCRLSLTASEYKSDNILHECRQELQNFIELTTDYVGFGAKKTNKTKTQRLNATANMSHIMDVLCEGLSYMMNNRFLLREEN